MTTIPPGALQIVDQAVRQMKRQLIDQAVAEGGGKPLSGTYGANGQVQANALGGILPPSTLPANVAKVYSELIGDGVATTINVSHGLATSALVVQCWLVATPFTLQSPTSIAIPDDDTVTIVFSVAPATDAVRVVIVGR